MSIARGRKPPLPMEIDRAPLWGPAVVPSSRSSAHSSPRSLAGLSRVFGILAAAVFALAGTSSFGHAATQEIFLDSGLTPDALTKVDPHLVFALSVPRDEASLRAASRIVPIYGQSVDDLAFRVLIQSSLTDAELADLGVRRNSRVGDIVTARISEVVLARVAAHPSVQVIESEPWLQTTLDRSTVDVRAYAPSGGSTTGFSGQGVLFGLIDNGIDVTHDDFKDPSGRTRILWAWDHGTDGDFPTGFNYGTEYSAAQIDRGEAGALGSESGHGSHVAGISVGDGSSAGSPYRGIAPEADIIAVRNIRSGSCDLFCYGGGGPYGPESTRGSIDALVYLKQKAQILGRPLVINQSQGVMMGPHDGSTLFEKTYDQLIAANNIILTVAAGNDQTADWHGSVQVPPNGRGTMHLVHGGGQDAEESLWFELWWNRGERYRISLRTPSGELLQIPLEARLSQRVTSRDDTVFFYATQRNPSNLQGQAFFSIQNADAFVETGTWEVLVESQDSASSGRVHLYCERNQPGLAVQNPDLRSIVGMPGTAANVITVGSYNTRFDWISVDGPYNAPVEGGGLGAISEFSSQGPRRDGVTKPDIAAPGHWIVSVLATGFQTPSVLIEADGKHMVLSGTSMASPHVAGAIALMLQKDPTLTYNEVKQILRTTARQDIGTGPVPNDSFGAGKLDVKAAVEAVEGATLCAMPGDANVSGSTNVADVVAAVNHILGFPLSKDGLLCADLAGGDGRITVNDVTAIVNVIVGNGRPAPLTEESEPKAIAWGERVLDSQFELLLDPAEVGGLQVAFLLPLGWELGADPYLTHARLTDGTGPGADSAYADREAHASGAMEAGARYAVQWRKRLQVYHLLAYSPVGALLSDTENLRLVVPVRRVWDSGEGMERFGIERLVLSAPGGKRLVLEAEPTLGGDPETEPGPPGSGGMRSYLSRVSPNPMIELAQISYDLAESGRVVLTVFSAAGRRVRDLTRGPQVAGSHTVLWDGRNDAGEEVADGVYFVRLDTRDGVGRQKIHVVR